MCFVRYPMLFFRNRYDEFQQVPGKDVTLLDILRMFKTYVILPISKVCIDACWTIVVVAISLTTAIFPLTWCYNLCLLVAYTMLPASTSPACIVSIFWSIFFLVSFIYTQLHSVFGFARYGDECDWQALSLLYIVILVTI